jgi:hypothetical protein
MVRHKVNNKRGHRTFFIRNLSCPAKLIAEFALSFVKDEFNLDVGSDKHRNTWILIRKYAESGVSITRPEVSQSLKITGSRRGTHGKY